MTLSPFMGFDSIEPYKRHTGKGLILLCRTSNPGGSDLQAQPLEGGEKLFERIARLAAGEWGRGAALGLVVGATYPEEVARVRALAPTLPLLVPGIGAQGGDAAATVRAGWRAGPGETSGPVIVSSSRAVLYAGEGSGPGSGPGSGLVSTVDAYALAARGVAEATRALLQAARG